MRQLRLPSGNTIPLFGLGTWRMGEQKSQAGQEIGIIREAIERGVRLIDTAEMYGEGGAEIIIGEAIGQQRDGLFLVSKFYPHNAAYKDVLKACDRSLKRMNCDYLDLYLLHWPGNVPLAETFEALQVLQSTGKIRDYGVSNFDHADLNEIPLRNQALLGCNQVFYNLAHREVESQVTAWCAERAIPLMAYSPLDQGSSLLRVPALLEMAGRYNATSAQIALAWLLHQPNTVVIPKTVHSQRLQENLDAIKIELGETDLAELDKAFPPPDGPVRLSMR